MKHVLSFLLLGAGFALAAPQAPPLGGKGFPFSSAIELPKGPLYCKIQRESVVKTGQEAPKTTKASSEYWIKGKSLRVEQQIGTQPRAVMIVVEQTAGFSFNKGDKVAKKLDALRLMMASARARELMPQAGKRTKMGDETVAGKPCEIFTVEVTSPMSPARKGKDGKVAPPRVTLKPVKEWVWKERGLVLKRETARETADLSFREHMVVTEIAPDKPIDEQIFSIKGMEVVESPGGFMGPGGLRGMEGLPSRGKPRK